MTSYGILVQQEKKLPYGMKLVREIKSYYPCYEIHLNVLNDQQIYLQPVAYPGKESYLSSPSKITLRPF
jgi:hypothetical protein